VKFGIAQLSPAGHDGRAAAGFLTKLAPGRIDDIVYVDNHALWEMRFYLGTQVREAWARRTPYEPAYQPHRRLAELLDARSLPAGRLYVVNPRSTVIFGDTLHAHRLCAAELGRDAESVVYRAEAAGPGGCSPYDGARAAHGR
jgi:hypothetical protein